MNRKPGVEVFERDIESNQGYLYTKTSRLSSNLAIHRSLDVILRACTLRGRNVLDLACGDGFFTIRFWDSGKPARLFACDAAIKACVAAKRLAAGRPIHMVSADAHSLPYRDDSFDIVMVQSVLHHDYDPLDMIREAFRVAPTLVIHEPNGYNPGLKVIEKVSPYHIEHEEKSYTAGRLERSVREAGGVVLSRTYAGFVPMFSPDWLARSMKAVEPVVERIPILKQLGCAICVIVAARADCRKA